MQGACLQDATICMIHYRMHEAKRSRYPIGFVILERLGNLFKEIQKILAASKFIKTMKKWDYL